MSYANIQAPMRYRQVRPELLDAAAASPDVYAQQKVDGIRAQLRIEANGAITVVSGAGKRTKSTTAAPTVRRIEKWAQLLREQSDGRIWLDGEIVGSQWWVFDAPWVAEASITPNSPFSARIQAAEYAVLPLRDTHIRVLPTARTRTEKRRLIDRARTDGAEGVMLKHRASPYQFGQRVPHSLKAKFTHTVDAVVLDRNVPGPRGSAKENAVLGLYRNGKLVEIGRCSMIGKPDAQPGDVVEVRYLYAGTGGRLVQPTLLRIRDDKADADCTNDQLRFASRAVVAF